MSSKFLNFLSENFFFTFLFVFFLLSRLLASTNPGWAFFRLQNRYFINAMGFLLPATRTPLMQWELFSQQNRYSINVIGDLHTAKESTRLMQKKLFQSAKTSTPPMGVLQSAKQVIFILMQWEFFRACKISTLLMQWEFFNLCAEFWKVLSITCLLGVKNNLII